jgi:hypothetical protein
MPPKRKNPRLTVRRKSLNDSDGSEDETFENEEVNFSGRRRSSRLQEKELIYEEVPEPEYTTSRSLRSSRRNQKKTEDVETLFDGIFLFPHNKQKTSSKNQKKQKKEKEEMLQKR